MKKTYSKPELFYERYELTSSIAGNCAVGLPVQDITPTNYFNCTVDIGGGDKLFLDEGIGCNTEPIEGNGFCYETFALNEMLWSS